MCGTGPLKMLQSEEAYALSGEVPGCARAQCPQYTGLMVFLLIIYGFFLALNFTFRPQFMRKPGSSASDPNNLDPASACLYALLWTGLLLLAIALVVRCRACM
jgi:hypothetical protein